MIYTLLTKVILPLRYSVNSVNKYDKSMVHKEMVQISPGKFQNSSLSAHTDERHC